MMRTVARSVCSFPESPRRGNSAARCGGVWHSARRGKVARMLAFVGRYRDCCAALAAREWRAC